MEKQILWSVNQGIGRFTFNRPEQANSIGLASCADMIEGINRMAEPDVRVFVITGRGKFFNTGGDIGEFLENQGRLDQLVDLKSHLDLEHALMVQSAKSADCKEGITAFIERRAPNFVGS